MHYPRDITVGAGVGVGLASLHMRILPWVRNFMRNKSSLVQYAILQAFAVFVYVVMRIYHKHCPKASEEDVEEWRVCGTRAYKKAGFDKPLEPVAQPLQGYTGMVGVLSGLAAGESTMKYMPLPYPKTYAHASARALLGLPMLMSAFLGLRFVEKSYEKKDAEAVAKMPGAIKEPSAIVQSLRFARYASVPVVILNIAPVVFKRLSI